MTAIGGEASQIHLAYHLMPTLTEWAKTRTGKAYVVLTEKVNNEDHFITVIDGLVTDFQHDSVPIKKSKYAKTKVVLDIEVKIKR
jgi:LEA14-like dessication related protein